MDKTINYVKFCKSIEHIKKMGTWMYKENKTDYEYFICLHIFLQEGMCLHHEINIKYTLPSTETNCLLECLLFGWHPIPQIQNPFWNNQTQLSELQYLIIIIICGIF